MHYIISEISQEGVNWDKPQLVISNKDGRILLTNSSHTENNFSATVIGVPLDADMKTIGFYSDSWIKHIFRPFKGQITLSNDPLG